MIGPIVGPPTIQSETKVIAVPRVRGAKMSPRAAGTLLIGAEANMPPINRVTSKLVMFLLVALPMLKRPYTKTAGSMAHLRPYVSLMGAQNMGPKAQPRFKIKIS